MIDPTQDDKHLFTQIGMTFKLIGDSWQALKINADVFLLIAWLPLLILSLILPSLSAKHFWQSGSMGGGFLIFLTVLLILIFVCILLPTITYAQIASARHQKITVSQAFYNSRNYFWRYPLLMLLIGILALSGLILFIIPGLLVIFFLSMASYILVDQNSGVIDTMHLSLNLIKHHWRWVLSLLIVEIVIAIISYIPIIGGLIGIILAVIYFCLPAIIYVKITNNPKHTKTTH